MSDAPYREGPVKAPTFLVTTTDSLEGYRITRYLGVVHAESAPPSGLTFVPLLVKHQEAYQSLEFYARQVGANAVVGLRYSVLLNHVTAYGTAVTVERV